MDDPDPRPLLHILYEIMAYIPGLLEDSDQTEALLVLGTNIHEEVEAFRERLVKILRDLFDWRWDWELQYPQTAFEVPINPATSLSVDENREPLYPTILMYTGFDQCRGPMYYNTLLLLILRLAKGWGMDNAPFRALSLCRHQDWPLPSNPLILPHEALTIAEVCTELCRSIEYLQDAYRAAAVVLLQLPLGVMIAITEDEGQKLWLSRIRTGLTRWCT